MVGVFLAARSYRRATRPVDRAAALAAVSVVIVYALQAYGDMGLQSWEGLFITAAALGVAGRLADETGAWPRARAVAGSLADGGPPPLGPAPATSKGPPGSLPPGVAGPSTSASDARKGLFEPRAAPQLRLPRSAKGYARGDRVSTLAPRHGLTGHAPPTSGEDEEGCPA